MFDLIPWRERKELSQLRREMDNLFDRFFEGWPFRLGAREGEWAPSLDISETQKDLLVKVEVPGIDPKDIDISLHGDMLTIKGERKQEKEEKDENFHRIERSYGVFSRSIRLPVEVEGDKVKATYKNGVLKITLPKVKEAASKKIEVMVE